MPKYHARSPLKIRRHSRIPAETIALARELEQALAARLETTVSGRDPVTVIDLGALTTGAGTPYPADAK
jgi:hypothetical protein